MKGKWMLAWLLIACNAGNAQSYKFPFQIVYTVFQPDSSQKNWDIRKIMMDGSNDTAILTNSDMAFAYTSKSHFLYYISNENSQNGAFHLFEWNSKTGSSRKCSNLEVFDGAMCFLSDDSILLASRSTNKSTQYLIALNIHTGNYRTFLSSSKLHLTEPTLSPDRSKMVFVGRKKEASIYSETELYVYDIKRSQLTEFTHHKTKSLAKEGFTVSAPQWHPTENFISYVGQKNGVNKIFRINIDGTNEKLLFSTSFATGWHHWSEDGKWLVYQQSDVLGKQFHIMLQRWPDGKPFQLTSTEYRIQLGPLFLR